MNYIQLLLIIIVITLHVGFMFIEIFLWSEEIGLKIFKMTEEKAKETKVLAINQGVYNGFLVGGLIWSLIDPNFGPNLALFFLTCVLVAGIVGALTASKKIFIIQGLPALIAILTFL